MSKANGSKSFFKTYGFLIFMLTGIVAGCLVGAFARTRRRSLLGTLFINMMFCGGSDGVLLHCLRHRQYEECQARR